MNNEWTVERLEALPEGTVVAWEGAYYRWAFRENPGSTYGWVSDCGERWSSAEIFKSADPGTIRVVSLPTDALLAEMPEEQGYHLSLTSTEIWEQGGWNNAVRAIRAAIAHVIGEAP